MLEFFPVSLFHKIPLALATSNFVRRCSGPHCVKEVIDWCFPGVSLSVGSRTKRKGGELERSRPKQGVPRRRGDCPTTTDEHVNTRGLQGSCFTWGFDLNLTSGGYTAWKTSGTDEQRGAVTLELGGRRDHQSGVRE